MAKEKGATEAQPKPVSNVRTFFTKEINDQIAAMTPKEMENSLKDLMGTRQFIALLKYTGLRSIFLDTQLRTVNPTENPHLISWAQGCMAGVCDIENYIIDISAPKAKQEEPEEDQPAGGKPEGVIMG